MLLTEFSFCDDDDHMTITHILTTPTVELSPVAAMYVDPMVLIFSTLLNLGLISNWKEESNIIIHDGPLHSFV